MNPLKSIFGSRNERALKKCQKLVTKSGKFESDLKQLSDEDLSAKTAEFRERLSKGVSLDSLLPEAFAVVREAGVRVLGMRHFDVQLIGGMTLHRNKIAEMRTGEGKTLVATLPVYLNALTGRGVHVITVNDYLATRDAEWMKPLYEFLGLTVGVIVAGMSSEQKREAYAADVTYGTNNEFGFDYLRDNMVHSLEEKVQRPLHFAIIDEVDSILIDEARTPLIISGQAEDSSALYVAIDKLIPGLKEQEEKEGAGDYSVDAKTKQVFLTDDGHAVIEKLLIKSGLLTEGESLYDYKNIALMHHINAALKAHVIFARDVDYIVQNNEVVIVDEHTGRTMPGRRWSEGLHQAVEAKEGVSIQNENQTMASITFQNYFRLYEKLGGMTGTADTEAYEFQDIYGLEVIVIPTNKPMLRDDQQDLIYLTAKEKFTAITEDIKKSVEEGKPVLVGTVSIETSELVSSLLKKEGVKHQVLNAKFHEKEAHIVAQAGFPSAVTIATNMAGRGTDIVLGGNPEFQISELENPTEEQVVEIRAQWKQNHQKVLDSGGLRIIGTERHESRRIDNQLRGRSGRQGDPGSSCFYISMEDELMRRFMGDRMQSLLSKLGMGEGEPIQAGMISKSIEKAQRKVEGFNYEIRKSLLEFDDVANDQRKVFYAERNDLLAMDDVSSAIEDILSSVLSAVVEKHIPQDSLAEQWDVAGLEHELSAEFNLKLDIESWLVEDDSHDALATSDMVLDKGQQSYTAKHEGIGPEALKPFEKSVMLQSLDTHWLHHLAAMDHLRQGIHLRGYAQKNPTQEYKRESFTMFNEMLEQVKHDIISNILRIEIPTAEELEAAQQQAAQASAGVTYIHDDAQGPLDSSDDKYANVGRNEPCPCGSGKKFKHCHGKAT